MLLFTVPLRSKADPPTWWWDTPAGGGPVVDGNPVNHKAPANVGQAKWMATRALQELAAVLGEEAPVVVSIRHDLFKNHPNCTLGVFYPGRPENPSPEWLAEQRSVLTIGQLKALAAPFYRALSAFDPDWVEAQFAANQISSSEFFTDTDGTLYPWNPAENSDVAKNHSPASIGQLKAVFSLRFEEVDLDSDGDGLPDLDELLAGTDPYLWDTDYDGLSDYQEIVITSTDPLDEDSDDDSVFDSQEDPDGDGLTHANEVYLNTNPFNADSNGNGVLDGAEDADQDFFTALKEVQYSTNPWNWDTDGDGLGDFGEARAGTDPKNPGADTDGDNIPDKDEADSDFDGLPDFYEPRTGNDPLDPDSDNDGILDGDEDFDDDGYTNGTEVDQHTDAGDPVGHPDAEILILTGGGVEDEQVSKYRKVTLPADGPLSYILVVGLASEEYPQFTGDSSTDYDDIVNWSIEPQGQDVVSGQIGVYARHNDWVLAELNHVEWQGFGPVHFEKKQIINRTPGQALTVQMSASATNISDGQLPSTVIIGLLPIQPVELAPLLKDDADTDIAGSQKPTTEPDKTNEMVELVPNTNRMAHRHMKLHVPEAEFLENKTITWSMDPLYTVPATTQNPNPAPHFRRQEYWASCPVASHQNRFESAAEAFGAYNFSVVGAAPAPTAKTKFDANIDSAVRANLPPIGFNKARVKLEIEGVTGDPAIFLDMEVPAIVVIDPGHGGDPAGPRLGGSDPNHAVGKNSGALEKDIALDVSRKLRNSLISRKNLNGYHAHFYMTRDADVNYSLATRANKARDRGADILLSIHLNATTNHVATRGCEAQVDTDGNYNKTEDMALADEISAEVYQAQALFDSGAFDRGPKDDQPLGVLSDPSLGNMSYGGSSYYIPVRATLAELEFIDMDPGDNLLNVRADKDLVREVIAERVAAAIFNNIRTTPSQ